MTHAKRMIARALLIALLPVTSSGILAPIPANAADTAQQAEELFQRGKALYKSGKKQEAYEALAAAWALKKSHDIAANLGSAELALGRARDASEHFAYCVRTFPATGSKKQLATVKKLFDEARSQVGALSVKANVEGAEVLVDGRAVGRTPLEDEVFVEPGSRTIEAKLAGYEAARANVQVTKGLSQQVTLTLTASPPPSGAAQKPAPPSAAVQDAPPVSPSGSAPVPPPNGLTNTSPLGNGPYKTVLIAGGSLAGATLISGIVLTVLANGKASDARVKRLRLVHQHGPAACTGEDVPAQCQSLADADEARATLSNAALWTYVGAGALAIGTVVVALVARPVPTKTGFFVTPTLSLSSGGIMIKGAF